MRLAAVMLVGACGRIDFDPLTPVDAPCTPTITLPAPPTSPFNAPTLLATLNSPTDFDDDPTLTGDQLEIVFQSARGGMNRLWRSVRATANDPWPAPAPITELDAFTPNTPELSRDGLRMRFSAPGPIGGEDLYLVTRPDRASPWGAPVHLAELSSTDTDSGAVEFLDGYGLVLFRAGDLLETVNDACAGFPAPMPLTGAVQTGAVKANPWMRNDGLIVVYPTMGTTGVSDLHIATRDRVGGPFVTLSELTTLNSNNVDDDPWVADDLRVIYFMSARTGNSELYMATR